jgi:hypothetical protein
MFRANPFRRIPPVRKLLFACPFAVFAVGIPSQSTWVVGGAGGLPQIRQALAVAQPGDTIEVRPGTYAQFTAAVGVTIRAVSPGTVLIVPDPAYYGPCLLCNHEARTVLAPPVGQSLHVSGLVFTNQSAAGVTTWLEVRDGRVTLDECTVYGVGLSPSACVWIVDAHVHLQDCFVSYGAYASGFAGIHAVDSVVTAVDTRVQVVGPFTNGHCLRLPGTTFQGSRLTLSGIGESCVVAGGAPVWISDSQLSGGGPNHCTVTGAVELSRCTLWPPTAGCGVSGNGGSQLGVSRPSALQAGGTFQLDFQTTANGFVLVFAGPELAAESWAPLLVQPSWLQEATSFPVTLLLADAQGAVSVSWPIPAGPGITNQKLWFKGLSGWSFPLQVSPPVGGVVR